MLFCMLALSVSSCMEDELGKYQNTPDALLFKVEVSDVWSERAASSSTSIRRMSQSTDAEPLYLVTKTFETTPVKDIAKIDTRGTTVETTIPLEEDVNGFGLSAICYTGKWPAEGEENKWTTNFAHNLQVTFKDKTTWTASQKLNWPGSGNIRFFAYYPYSDGTMLKHSGKEAEGAPVLTYTVPEDVTKQPDLLYAVADYSGKGVNNATLPGSEGNTGKVSLEFKHALTAITIKTGKDMLAGTITGIKLSNVYGSGEFNIDRGTWKTTGEAKEFSITGMNVKPDNNTSDKGSNMKPDQDVTSGELTFMMIPQALATNASLTIYFTDDLTNTARTLTATIGGTDKEWPSGKKVTYSINSTGIEIEPVLKLEVKRDGQWPCGGYKLADFKEIIKESNVKPYGMYGAPMTKSEKEAYLPVSGYLRDVVITAYAKVTQLSATEKEGKEKKVELPFTIEYYDESESEWQQAVFKPKDETTATISEDIDSLKKGTIVLPAQRQFEEMQKYFKEGGYNGGHNWIAHTHTSPTFTDKGKGSKDNPYDLVNKNPIKQESANCYIINDHGYYMFPVCYGNTYGATNNSAYAATPTTVTIGSIHQSDYQLVNFVGHDDKQIASGQTSGTVWIEDLKDAVIIWQDSPDLVEDVQLIKVNNNENWISFHTAPETLNQGNAVIAVRNNDNTILWSWHIWATHYNWQDKNEMIETGYPRADGKPYMLTPCNLGYCEPHEADDERKISIRFKVTMPDGSVKVMAPKNTGCPSPNDDGEITFTQPAIAESVAGDNTYYQWGRKDPMLPGVYDNDIYTKGKTFCPASVTNTLHATFNELTMNNKVFYSTEEYRIRTEDTGKSIGESIKFPYKFFVHKRPESDTGSKDNIENDILRRHWHDGSAAGYKKHTLMNYWNSELYQANKEGTLDDPNGIYVRKTIYDPSPAGFKIPSPNAYIWLFIKNDNTLYNEYKYISNISGAKRIYNGAQKIGWVLPVNNETIFFPATGVRNIGLKLRDWNWGTTPAFADLTFIASAGFIDQPKNVSDGSGTITIRNYSCSLFSIDDRVNKMVENETQLKVTYPTANSYGFSLRPVLDIDKAAQSTE